MTGIGETNFLQALGWAVLNSLWQMAFLWIIYVLITGIHKTAKSSVKSTLATFLILAGFGWFLYTFISIFINHVSDTPFIVTGIVSAEGKEQLNSWFHQTLPIASVLYLVLLILPSLHFIRNYRYVQIIRQYGLTKADVQLRMFVKKVAAQMGIKKPVYLWVSELVSSPVTIGYLKPVILFPLAAINNLTTQQLEAVLLHELSHIGRYDYLINLIINFIQTILYFNPFVKTFVKTIEREREKSCDEMVIQFQYDPHGYASALLMLEKINYLPKPLAIAAAGKKNDLLHRVELILGFNKRSVISVNKMACLLAGLLFIIALNALLIMTKPEKGNQALSFTQLSSPFYFFTGDNPKTTTPVPVEKKSAPITNHIAQTEAGTKIKLSRQPLSIETPLSTAVNPSDLINVNFKSVAIPPLKNYQEVQVKEAVESSKKVIENIQWKEVEKSIADIFTQKEKEKIRSTFKKGIEKIEWNKLEDKLRLAYENIDWDRINDQLGKAVNQIRLDSLQKVYNLAAGTLDILQQQLSENDLKGIPDTGITMKEVENKKQQVEKVLSNLKALRSKKIVHL